MRAIGIWGAARSWCRRARFALGASLVAVVSVAAYGRVLDYGFIYDDYWTVVGNTHLDKPLRELVAAALSGRSVEWNMPDATRPWMGLSLWLDRRLFGLAPAGYHLHSLGLYALACVLVFFLAFGVLRQFAAALCAALVFAVVPLHVEVATAINYREDLIAAVGMFGAAAIWFWPARREWRWRSVACGALWAYALLGKESALIAPALIAALSIGRRAPPAPSNAVAPAGLVCGVVAALWLNWRFGMSRLGEQIPTADSSSAERALRSFRFEVLSVFKSLAPLSPRPEGDPPGSASFLWIIAFGLILAAVVWLARRRRTRVLAAAGAVALVAPLFTSPLVSPLNEFADRYWFVGSLAAALVVGWMACRAWGRQVWLATAVLVAGCSVATWRASSVWASEVNLWSFVVQTSPRSPRAWAALSRVHRLADQEELAEAAVTRSLALRPQYPAALSARIINQLWYGRLEAARAGLRRLEAIEGVRAELLRIPRRCATSPDASAAQACARSTVPAGLVLGDPEHLRVVTERLLAEPFESALPVPSGSAAGVDPVPGRGQGRGLDEARADAGAQ